MEPDRCWRSGVCRPPTDASHSSIAGLLNDCSVFRFEEMESSLYSNLVGLKTLTEGYEAVLSLPQVQALANASYDLVIMEMFNSDLFFGLVHKIGAPVIGFSSCQVLVWFADHLAVPTDLAYLPHIIGGISYVNAVDIHVFLQFARPGAKIC